MKTCPLTSDDSALIRELRVEKGREAPRMMKVCKYQQVHDRVYANLALKRYVPVARLLKGLKHFSQNMVSVTVSNLGKTSLVFVPSGSKVDNVLITVTSFWIRVYYQTLGSCLVITSLFNRMVRQLIVHDKQFYLCVFMCQNLWYQKIGRQIAQT